jgi:hypothetical protein
VDRGALVDVPARPASQGLFVISLMAAVLAGAAVLAWSGEWNVRRRRRRLVRVCRGRPQLSTGDDLPAGSAVVLSTPMLLDLVGEVLVSGASPSRALARVGACLERVHDPTGSALLALARRLSAGSVGSVAELAGPRAVTTTGRWGYAASTVVPAGGGMHALESALALSNVTGAGPVALLRAAAEEHRRRTHAEQVRAAHRLGVLVLLPTGLCLLPAFVLLTIVPLVIDLVLS